MNYTHRLAILADLPAIVAIYNSTIASRQVTSDLEPISVESRLPWFEAHTPDRRPLWVAERDGQIIGWLSYSDFYGRPAYAGTSELSVYIDASARGQGLGRYFIEQAIAHAPTIGVHTLLAFIFAHNMPSVQLFSSFEFSQWAHMPGVATLDGVDRDLVILGKRLY
jgi:L-amino acid N-acyltransferase YncA